MIALAAPLLPVIASVLQGELRPTLNGILVQYASNLFCLFFDYLVLALILPIIFFILLGLGSGILLLAIGIGLLSRGLQWLNVPITFGDEPDLQMVCYFLGLAAFQALHLLAISLLRRHQDRFFDFLWRWREQAQAAILSLHRR